MNLNDLKKLTKHQKMARFRSPLEQNEHCPVCDKHVPDVRYKGTLDDLEQVDFSADSWILADGSVAVEDGHGGLMVEICADCIAVDRQIRRYLPQNDDGPYDWCTETNCELTDRGDWIPLI